MKQIDDNGNIKVYTFDGNPNTRKTVATVTRVFTLGEREVLDEGETYATVTVEILQETEKATQLLFSFIEDGEETDFMKDWLPKSQLTYTEDGYEIPEWLSKEKRLGKYTVQKMVVEDGGAL